MNLREDRLKYELNQERYLWWEGPLMLVGFILLSPILVPAWILSKVFKK